MIGRLALAAALAFGAAAEAHAAAPDGVAQSFLWVAVILVAAKLGSLVERAGQPVVLGEILVGVVLGNLALVGIGFAEPMRADAVIAFLAQLGAVILLFQIGLESNVRTMRKVGARAFWVATIGVAAPFALGTWVVGPWLLPGLVAMRPISSSARRSPQRRSASPAGCSATPASCSAPRRRSSSGRR